MYDVLLKGEYGRGGLRGGSGAPVSRPTDPLGCERKSICTANPPLARRGARHHAEGPVCSVGPWCYDAPGQDSAPFLVTDIC